MNKKIIFFDGDGTLWYPKKTKRNKPPYWIYKDKHIEDDYLKYLVLTPFTLPTLKKLKKMEITLVLLSTSPYSFNAAKKKITR